VERERRVFIITDVDKVLGNVSSAGDNCLPIYVERLVVGIVVERRVARIKSVTFSPLGVSTYAVSFFIGCGLCRRWGLGGQGSTIDKAISLGATTG
jgi:hypothetical protein